MRPFSLAVARLHSSARSFARLGRRHAGLATSILCRGTIRLFVFGEFCPHPKFAKHYVASTSQKFSKKFLLFYIGGACPPKLWRRKGEKFIKGVFVRFRPPQPAQKILSRRSEPVTSEEQHDARQSEHKDIAHPITIECRERIQKKIMEAYEAGKDLPQDK